MIQSDWSEVERELKRLKRIPTLSDKRKLDRVIKFGLRSAQEIVHIETRSLYQSGKVDSSLRGNIYYGKFEFGGVSTGVNNPVDYAIYELEREGMKPGHGTHNFMRKTPELHVLWVKTIKDILRGKK